MGQDWFERTAQKLKRGIEFTIYETRWLLYPFYIKLILTLLVLCYHYWVDEEVAAKLIISVLHSADVAMIANLVKMIIVGSYNSFIDKSPSSYHVEKASSSGLKTKMSTSLVVVTSIFLLQVFLTIAAYKWDEVVRQLTIHVIFVIAALVLVIIEYIHIKAEYWAAMTEYIENKNEEYEAVKNKKEIA